MEFLFLFFSWRGSTLDPIFPRDRSLKPVYVNWESGLAQEKGLVLSKAPDLALCASSLLASCQTPHGPKLRALLSHQSRQLFNFTSRSRRFQRMTRSVTALQVRIATI